MVTPSDGWRRGPPRDAAVSGGTDEDSVAWLRSLCADGTEKDAAVAQLYDLLLGVARSETGRRAGLHGVQGPELEDMAAQAAGDAVMSILRRIDDFRGESRFTTWAYKFVIYEVSNKLGRHAWRRGPIQLDDADWERLPGRLGAGPEDAYEAGHLVEAVRVGVETVLTPHQRRVFAAIIVNGVPLDALVIELGTNRNAIYKTLFDARRKLRVHLMNNGSLEPDREGRAS